MYSDERTKRVWLDNVQFYVNFPWCKENKMITNDVDLLDVFVEYGRWRLRKVFIQLVYKPLTRSKTNIQPANFPPVTPQ